MKKLLFLGIVALMVQSLGAVTLPSTSYSPYVGGSSSSGAEQSLLTSGTIVTGSYSKLSSKGSEWGAQCTAGKTVDASGLNACKDCCDGLFEPCGGWDDEDCVEARTDCYNECGRSLGNEAPLDGGLSILLILSLVGGAVKVFRVKGQGSRDK